MKKLALVAVAAAALLLEHTAAARAGNTRIVLAGPAKDPIASRLQKELLAMGFEPIRVDDAAACATAAIAAWVEETNAAGAACSDGAGVAIWIKGRSGLRMTDAVTPREDVEEGPEVIAVRAAEIARASLELPASEVDPAFAASRPPPTWEPNPSAEAADAAAKLPPAVDPRKAPALAMGAGVSYIAGADAHAAAIDIEFEVRIVKSLSIATRAQVPLAPTQVENGRTIVKVSPGVISIGPSLALAAPESFFVPRLGTGIGFVWLRADATGAVVGGSELSATGQAVSNALTTRDDIVSPMAYVGASASLHIAGPVRFVLEGQVGTTAHRMVVRDQGTNIAYFGQPFGSVAGRGEVIFR